MNAEGTFLAAFDSVGVFHLIDFCQDEFVLSWALKRLGKKSILNATGLNKVFNLRKLDFKM